LFSIRVMLKAVSVIGYLMMAGALVTLLLTSRVLSPSPLVVLPQLGAVAMMIWARITFGRRSFHLAANPTEGGLVTTGPYRYIRHPIYAAVCLFATVGSLAHLSMITLLLCSLVWVGALLRLHAEERLLVAKYPDYKTYAATTSRMIPLVF
jgi:protein-S-isoprenylcysteine O-methyltransferase Ste14